MSVLRRPKVRVTFIEVLVYTDSIKPVKLTINSFAELHRILQYLEDYSNELGQITRPPTHRPDVA